MVELARQLKETSLLMNQSVQETEKVDLFWYSMPPFVSVTYQPNKTSQTCNTYNTSNPIPHLNYATDTLNIL